MFLLVRDPIDTQAITKSLQAPDNGALLVFEGVVRNNANGKNVRFLEYEAYEAMALKKIEEIGLETRDKFDIRDIAIVHRLGHMDIGECSIVIAVASATAAPLSTPAATRLIQSKRSCLSGRRSFTKTERYGSKALNSCR